MSIIGDVQRPIWSPCYLHFSDSPVGITFILRLLLALLSHFGRPSAKPDNTSTNKILRRIDLLAKPDTFVLGLTFRFKFINFPLCHVGRPSLALGQIPLQLFLQPRELAVHMLLQRINLELGSVAILIPLTLEDLAKILVEAGFEFIEDFLNLDQQLTELTDCATSLERLIHGNTSALIGE